MVQTVTGEYTDDHWDFVEPTDTDMLLVADPSKTYGRFLGLVSPRRK